MLCRSTRAGRALPVASTSRSRTAREGSACGIRCAGAPSFRSFSKASATPPVSIAPRVRSDGDRPSADTAPERPDGWKLGRPGATGWTSPPHLGGQGRRVGKAAPAGEAAAGTGWVAAPGVPESGAPSGANKPDRKTVPGADESAVLPGSQSAALFQPSPAAASLACSSAVGGGITGVMPALARAPPAEPRIRR